MSKFPLAKFNYCNHDGAGKCDNALVNTDTGHIKCCRCQNFPKKDYCFHCMDKEDQNAGLMALLGNDGV